MRFVFVILFAVPVLAGCTGDRQQIAIGPVPPRLTRGTLAGPLCKGDHCTCREATAAEDGGAGVPTDDRKRFEIRVGPSPQELWVTLRGMTFYKSAERAEECFYVDLPAGDSPVELRASHKDGVSAVWTIKELGSKTKSWYDTFAFNCGSPGVCSFEDLDAMHDELVNTKRNLRDPCGSTKIKGVAWDHGKAPDQLHPDELVVRLHLDIYKLVPNRAHGDPTCGKGRGPSDEPPAAGSAAGSAAEDKPQAP
jgi:hypothetical protein